MEYPFKRIIILYNPVSTGDSLDNAEELQKKLETSLSKTVKIELFPTQYPGHAEEIGAKYAKKPDTLLVSSSGDGGYNELVNGVLSQDGHRATVCVLPSGNANDHYQATNELDVSTMIIKGETHKIDALKLRG
jgi:diacylglycerol kinase (ATP)